MAYRVKEPEVSLLLKIGEVVDKDGSHVGYEHAGRVFLKDEVVHDDPDKAKQAGQDGPLSPNVVRLYEEGDVHTLNVIEKVSESKPAARGRPKAKGEEE